MEQQNCLASLRRNEASGQHGQATTDANEELREAAMAAFAKTSQRERRGLNRPNHAPLSKRLRSPVVTVRRR